MTEAKSQLVVRSPNAASSMTRSSPHNVPAETWDEIIQHLGHDDILFLSLTCKYLYVHLTELQTWRRRLRRICKQYGWFLPTFPLSTMNLAHLRRACMGPELWTTAVEKFGPEEVDLTADYRHLHQASRLDFPVEPQYLESAASYLIPGGRFFVSCRISVERKSVNVVLWDLGVPGCSLPPSPTVVAATDLHSVPDRIYRRHRIEIRISVYATEDTLYLAILLEPKNSVFDTDLKLSVEAHILSVMPGDSNPLFTKVNSCHLQRNYDLDRVPAFMVHKNRLLLAVNGISFIIWDFTSGHYGMVPTQRFQSFAGHIAMFTGRAFVTLDAREICLWEVPTLSMCMATYPQSIFLGQAVSTQEPVSCHVPWTIQPGPGGMYFRESHVSRCQQSSNFFFDTWGHGPRCERYEVTVDQQTLGIHIEPQAQYDRPSSLPLKPGEPGHELIGLSGRLFPSTLGCQETTMECHFHNGTGMVSRQYAFSIHPEEGEELHRTLLVPLPLTFDDYKEMKAGRDISIMELIGNCFGTGRCVFNNALHNHTISVYDFLR